MSNKVNLAMAVSTVANLKQILSANKDKMASSLPKSAGVSVDKILSTAIECVATQPALLKCTGQSILLAVKQAVEFGLSFSKAFGQAYLIPYGNTAQLIIGYRGLLDLARRALVGHVVFDSDVVYDGDEFEIVKGTKTEIIHKPNLTAERLDKNIIGAYMVATFSDGKQVVEYMTIGEINNIRARSKAANFGPWVTDFPAMCRKTVIRRAIKYLPLSSEKAKIIEKALEHDILTDGLNGTPTISAKDKLKALETTLADVDSENKENKQEQKRRGRPRKNAVDITKNTVEVENNKNSVENTSESKEPLTWGDL